MEKTKLIFIILGVVIIAVIVFSFGYLFGRRETLEDFQIEDPHWFVELQKSNVVLSHHLLLDGEVIEILNRTLTMSAHGDVLTVSIMENARLTTLKQVEGEEIGILEPKEITFQDIKIGDILEITAELISDGYLVGLNVTVVPFPPPPPSVVPPAALPTPGF